MPKIVETSLFTLLRHSKIKPFQLFVKCTFIAKVRKFVIASLMLHMKYIPLNFLWAFSFFVSMSESGQSCYVSLCFFITPSFLILFNFSRKVLARIERQRKKNCLCHIGYAAKSIRPQLKTKESGETYIVFKSWILLLYISTP